MKSSFGTTGCPDRNLVTASRRRAFTLVELLTVISIIVVLVGLTIGVVGIAQKKSFEEQARSQLGLMDNALKRYYETHGEYPENTDMGDTRGGQVLYQALTGDGSDLVGGETSPNGKLDDNERRESQDYRAIDPNNERDGIIAKDGDGKYTLTDPFGNPWNYRTYDKDNPSATHNTTYDIWSYGDDKTLEKERKWIKNWKSDDDDD